MLYMPITVCKHCLYISATLSLAQGIDMEWVTGARGIIGESRVFIVTA
jgi:hypothetical protein